MGRSGPKTGLALLRVSDTIPMTYPGLPTSTPKTVTRLDLRLLRRTLSLLGMFAFAALPALGAGAPGQADAEQATQAAQVKPAPKPQAKKPAPRYSAAASAARKATLARARAAAAREAAIPRFKTDATGAVVPDVHAAAAIIYNPETNEVVWEENSQDKRSIASITKVMTATVFFESDPDLSGQVMVDRSDVWQASSTHLRAGDRVKLDDLVHLLLIASDNAAARTLARTSRWGAGGFVARMNEKAAELGLNSTTYADPSGLDPANMSSAYDMARLITYAAGDDRISGIMRMPQYVFSTNRRMVAISSTNQLVRASDVEVRGGKTGFIAQAGYCLVTLLKLPDINQPMAFVVLGARSNAGRFIETRNLYKWLSTQAQQMLVKKQPEPRVEMPD
jgi:D-alanyl-D-alanine endopeptidase (penicillin-binding protein 7)